MQVADLFRIPLGVLSVKCPSRANQTSGFAGEYLLYEPLIVCNRKKTVFPRRQKAFVEEWEEAPPLCGGYTLRAKQSRRAGSVYIFRKAF